MWLAPVQITIVPVADRHLEYAEKVAGTLRDGGLRVEIDRSDETVGEKIRRALSDKHPAVLVVGDRDVENGTVGLRHSGDETEQRGLPVAEAVVDLVEMARPPR